MFSPAILFGVLLASSAVVNAEDSERMDRNVEYFITMPASTTVTIGGAREMPQDSNQTNQTVGEFQCATRAGYLPLWIVNGVSADLIQEEPGYMNTTYELYPLHDQGHMLTILTIPASLLTNYSVVTCAVVRNDTSPRLSIVGYSPPVHLFVLLNDTLYSTEATSLPVISRTNTVLASSTTPYPPGTREKTPSLTPQLTKGLGAGLAVLVLAVAALVICSVIIAFRRMNRHKRLKVTSRTGQSNVYWNSLNVHGLQLNINDDPVKEKGNKDISNKEDSQSDKTVSSESSKVEVDIILTNIDAA